MRKSLLPGLAGALLFSSGCMVGPKYQRPSAPVSPAYKEPPPDGWKEARPNDGVIRGNWWEIYNDPELNALEEQVSISNQNVLAAEAQFRAAKDAVHIARSALYPAIGAGPSISNSRTSSTLGNSPISNSNPRMSTRVMCFWRHSRITSSTKRRVTGILTGPTATSRPAFLPWKVAKPSVFSAR